MATDSNSQADPTQSTGQPASELQEKRSVVDFQTDAYVVPPDEEPGQKIASTEQHPELLSLYKQWIDVYDHRQALYQERITTALKNLDADIERWEAPLSKDPANKLALHHVVQFRIFAQKVFDALTGGSQATIASDPLVATEAADFRAMLVGVLTAQWMLLQNVIVQRLSDSPYRLGVDDLDKEASKYYARLFYALQGKLNPKQLNIKYRDNPLAPIAPLIHLGKTAQLTVFNQRVPLMLSIPLGALAKEADGENTRMSIPHEIAHAIFAQVPELIDEIKGKLKAQIEENDLPPREQVLNFLAINWTEEICADLVGTALAGEAFARSARWIMADSNQNVGLTDLSHPPALLRPMIHLYALNKLKPATGGYQQTLTEFASAVSKSPGQLQLGPTLQRRFRSAPALMFVSMDTISDILSNLVQRILDQPLATLSEATVADLLLAIQQEKRTTLPAVEPEEWGKLASDNRDDLVLDFPAGFAPDYMTPGVSTHPECCDSWFLRPLCCSTA